MTPRRPGNRADSRIQFCNSVSTRSRVRGRDRRSDFVEGTEELKGPPARASSLCKDYEGRLYRVFCAPSTTEAIERSCAYARRRALDLERHLGHEGAECTVVYWDRCAAEIVEYADDIDTIMDIDSKSTYPPAREVPGLSRAHAERTYSSATSGRRSEHWSFQCPQQRDRDYITRTCPSTHSWPVMEDGYWWGSL